MAGRDWPSHEKLTHASSHSGRDHPVLHAVAFLRHNNAPNPDRHHLEALAQHLHWEANVLHGLVLARAGVDTRDGVAVIDVGDQNGDYLPHVPCCGEN